MKKRTVLTLLFVFGLLTFLAQASDQFQYGFRFGIVHNSFSPFTGSTANPFATVDLNSKLGYTAGFFYDWQFLKGVPYLNLDFGVNYKLLYMKGNFTTNGATPLTGHFTDYYHLIDVPVGLKFIGTHFRGRPFIGAGFEMDWIVANNSAIYFDTQPAPTTTYVTTPPYSSRLNTGIYTQAGFEIPTSAVYWVLEFKYIAWLRDNFKPETSFFNRDKNEIQFTIGAKFR